MAMKIKYNIPTKEQMDAKIIDNLEETVDYLAKNLILAEAVDNAPLDKGDLRESGTTSDVERTKTIMGKARLQVKIFFTAPYAAIQHENEDYEHKIGGRAFYLRDALKGNTQIIKEQIAKRFRRVRF